MELEPEDEAAVGGGGEGEERTEWEHGGTVEGNCQERLTISNLICPNFVYFFFFTKIRI